METGLTHVLTVRICDRIHGRGQVELPRSQDLKAAVASTPTDLPHPPAQGLVHHSGQGSQYSAKDYRGRLEALGITASISHKGNPKDNAVVESFFSSLKNELTHHRSFINQDEVRSEIFDYIEIF